MSIIKWVRTAGVMVRNATLGGNLASLSLAGQPNNFSAYVTQCLFLYKCMTDKRGISQKHVFKILPCHRGELPITIPEPSDENLWFSQNPSLAVDILSLCLLCHLVKPHRIFEIGTFDGYSATAMALNSPPGAIVHTLDLPRRNAGKLQTTVVDEKYVAAHDRIERMAWDGTPAQQKITQLIGDSATFDFSPYHKRIDLFFIDGAHSYDYVRSDTAAALRCTHPASIIAWHDFGRMGVNGVARVVRNLGREREVVCVPGGTLAYMVV